MTIDGPGGGVELADGSAVEYDRLLLATGSHPRLLALPGAELAGVYYLRSVADVDRLRTELKPGRRAVIIGGGYIGLEVAATCREAGLDVTVLEAADRVMNRVVAPVVSQFYEAEHSRHGVKIHCHAAAESLVPGRETGITSSHANPVIPVSRPIPSATERVAAVRQSDGSELPADFVLVAIGVVPTDALARDAIRCDNGIVVDEYRRTTDPRLAAATRATQHSLRNACAQSPWTTPSSRAPAPPQHARAYRTRQGAGSGRSVHSRW